jgi:uncharacterized membrane protein YedE/YeeE
VKEFIVYTALRLGLFVAALAIISGVWFRVSDQMSGVEGLLVLGLAFVVSGVASYFLLNRQREAFARRVERRAERMQTRFEEMKSKEDVD